MTNLKTGTMSDAEYIALKLENHIASTQVRWPSDTTALHWAKLHRAVYTARSAVQAAWTENDRIEKSTDLTMQGKRKQRAEAAMAAITSLTEDKSLANAREAVERMMTRWAEKAAAVIKKPEDPHEVSLHQEIRQRVAAIDPKDRLGWLHKHAADPMVFSALLTAPVALTGLTEAELAMVNAAADASLGPEIAEAKAATEKALADLERGHRVAMKLIAERGGLRQVGGGWEIPKVAA
jgi:hypothetical protein